MKVSKYNTYFIELNPYNVACISLRSSKKQQREVVPRAAETWTEEAGCACEPAAMEMATPSNARSISSGNAARGTQRNGPPAVLPPPHQEAKIVCVATRTLAYGQRVC